VVLYLEGRTAEVTRRVRQRMDEAAQNMDFERAGELRDALRHLTKLEEPTVVVEVEGGDRDVLGYARDGELAVVTMLHIRAGKLLAREHQFVENIEDEGDDAVLAAYLARTYIPLAEHARELLIPFDVADRELIAETLPRTEIWMPQRGPRRQLIELADQNARHLLEEQKTSTFEAEERAVDPVYELQRELGLQSVPRAMICFDISTTQGTDTVASCVWFENGRPKRAEYRKFKIKTVEGTDDFASMREVVTRYFARRLDEQKPLPDLVVVDGGKGQLSSAREALEAVNLSRLPTISLAKRDEEIFIPGRSESIRLSKRSPALRMLQRMRDEAHRFAITYNRKRRSMRTVTSELLKIKGVGPEKRRALLNAFGSVQGVRDAGVEAIAQLPGFSAASAERLLSALAPQSGAPANPEVSHTESSESALPSETQQDVTNDPSAMSEMPPASEIAERG
jgi:excinuclease ABC subunit C